MIARKKEVLVNWVQGRFVCECLPESRSFPSLRAVFAATALDEESLRDGSGFQAFLLSLRPLTQAVGPGWYGVAPLALWGMTLPGWVELLQFLLFEAFGDFFAEHVVR